MMVLVARAQVVAQAFTWCQHWAVNPALIDMSVFTSSILHDPHGDHLHLQPRSKSLSKQAQHWWRLVLEERHHSWSGGAQQLDHTLVNLLEN